MIEVFNEESHFRYTVYHYVYRPLCVETNDHVFSFFFVLSFLLYRYREYFSYSLPWKIAMTLEGMKIFEYFDVIYVGVFSLHLPLVLVLKFSKFPSLRNFNNIPFRSSSFTLSDQCYALVIAFITSLDFL